jgi:hypothetical protein
VTTTILDTRELERLFSRLEAKSGEPTQGAGVSGQELVDRIKSLFTPEEAADLARRIEEGRATRHD